MKNKNYKQNIIICDDMNSIELASDIKCYTFFAKKKNIMKKNDPGVG